MEYMPPVLNKKAYYICFFSFLMFSACYAAITVWGKLIWLFQLLAILCAVVFIQVLIRYVMARHRYILDGDNFIIVRRMGKKETVVCDVTLRMSMGITDKSGSRDIEKNFGPVYKTYNYCQNIFPKECSFYIFELAGKRCAVTFEPDQAFLLELKKRMSAKEV